MPETISLFAWNDAYRIDGGAIDAEHQSLFALVDQLDRAMREGRGKQDLETLLDGLTQYALHPFQHEEELMQRSAYPRLDVHRRQHDEFRSRVTQLQTRFHRGEQLITIECMHLLAGWLQNHVLSSDMAMGGHFRGKAYPAIGYTPAP
jgi:hemerythrin-like metal-binding protein